MGYTRFALQSWSVCPVPRPHARVRMFCFPYAGGSASLFATWSKYLPEEVEVHAVQLPGRENRLKEPLFQSMPPLIEALADSLHLSLDIPFVFFGHSLGALIAFELTRVLRQRGCVLPLHLILSARNAPQTEQRTKRSHALPEAEFIEELRHYGGTPEIILRNDELRSLFLPILRADFALFETYQYVPDRPLALPITIFGGQQDEMTTRQQLEGWREQTSSDCTLRMVPDGHFFIATSRELFLRMLTEELQTILHLQESTPAS